MSEPRTAGPVVIDHDFLQTCEGITDLQGQEYINHRGLLALGHLHGLSEVVVTLIDFSPETGHAIVSATAKGDRGTFTDIADASPDNVGPRTMNATPRMASTRAINRSLRLYLGIGATTAEEIGPEARSERRPAPRTSSTPSRPSNGAPAGRQGAAEAIHGAACPECGSELWDNRDRRENEGWRGPAWKCKDRDCVGHKGEPWIQWESNPWPIPDDLPGDDPEAPAHSSAFKKAVAAAQITDGDIEVPF